MTQKRSCTSCGAVYDPELSKCPYCGTLNLAGAEAEYFERLEEVREDLEALEDVPIHETKREVRKQGAFLKRVFVVLGSFLFLGTVIMLITNRDEKVDRKAEYQWKQEVFPVLDALYEEKKFADLIEMFHSITAEEDAIWDWEHADFCDSFSKCMGVEELILRDAAGTEIHESDYVYLLYYGFLFSEDSKDGLSEEEQEILAPYMKRVQEDFSQRWSFTAKDLEAIAKEREKNYGLVSYSFCEKYIKSWAKQKKQ